MNIFEELAEGYTYNGAVSLKAITDDIVTLENQIDSFNATLREVQLRGKKPGILIEKIRDAKIRLSLLKALYKKESNRATPDEIILNVLGISANSAKETSEVSTAADGKEPKPQNFETAELEGIVEETSGEEVKIPEAEKVVDNEVVVSQEDEADMQADVMVDKDLDDGVIVVDENATEQDLKELYTSLTSEDTVIVAKPEILAKVKQEQEEKAEEIKGNVIKSTDETDFDTLVRKAFPPVCKEVAFGEVNVASVPVEKDTKTVDAAPISNIKDDTTSSHENVPVQPLVQDDCLAPSNDDKGIKENEIESVEDSEIVPAPTIDDYLEPQSGPSYEKISYDENGVVYNCEKEQELTETLKDFPNNPKDWIIENPSEKKPYKEDTAETVWEPRAYDAFYRYDNKIYVSFDLCGYTDRVNTNSITGLFDTKRKTLELTFTDARDYSLFLFFLNEKNKKCGFLSRFEKKPRSIIMYVRTEVDGTEKEYRYEFTGCRLVEVFDSEYKSMRDSVYYPTSTHEFFAKFKYKRLKIG